METFYEKQKFNQLWVLLILGFSFIAACISAYVSSMNTESVIALIVIGIICLLFTSINLESKIDTVGISYRMTPFELKYKTIKWEDLESVEVRTYSPIKEFGGWGWRIGNSGSARNIKGNKGIQTIQRSGKKLLIGTQKPKFAEASIENFFKKEAL
jgi:hypothetical protein